MEIKVDQKVLLRALKRATATTGKSVADVSWLDHVRIEGRMGQLVVTGTDTSVSYTGKYPADVVKAGVEAVQASRLLTLVRGLAGEVELSTLGKASLAVRAGRSRYRLPRIPNPDELPTQPATTGTSMACQVSSDDLSRLVRQAYTVHRDAYGMNGVSIVAKDGRMAWSATDGHRAARSACDVSDLSGGWPDGRLLALHHAELLAKSLPAATPVSVECTSSWVRFSWEEDGEEHAFVSRLREGTFPNLDGVIEGSPRDWRVVLDGPTLVGTARRLERVTNLSANAVATRYELGEDQIALSATGHGSDTAEGQEVVEVKESEGPLVALGLNSAYVVEALDRQGWDTMKIEGSHPLKPVFLSDGADGADEGFVLIMPMRID